MIPRAERVAQDLRGRSPASTVAVASPDFLDAGAIGRLADQVLAADKGPIDLVLIAHGWLAEQGLVHGDLARDHRLGSRRSRPQGHYTYGAAKAFIERYAPGGLQHRLAGSRVAVVLVKPSPTDTPMAAPVKARGGRPAPVEELARTTVRGIDAPSGRCSMCRRAGD